MVSSEPNTARQLLEPLEGWQALPYAWGGPVAAGSIRVYPEDFQVFELPLVSPAGEGEHSWLYVRKRNSNTQWVAQQLAQFAGVPSSAVSYAGLKDRHAVTEQWFSVHLPGRADPDWKALAHEEFQVLAAKRHLRKLKRGALRGNRFVLRVREVAAPSESVEQRMRQLAAGGFPNSFGPQRFGRHGANLSGAASLFAASRSGVSRHRRGIFLSAARSALFNRVLAARIADGCWNTAMPGEALQLQGKSACFVAGEVDSQIRQRVERLELHPTGPLCGDGEMLATGEAAEYEARQLRPCAEWIAGLRRFRLGASRRALRATADDLTWARDKEGDWVLTFSLSAGSYATSLLREVFDLGDCP